MSRYLDPKDGEAVLRELKGNLNSYLDEAEEFGEAFNALERVKLDVLDMQYGTWIHREEETP